MSRQLATETFNLRWNRGFPGLRMAIVLAACILSVISVSLLFPGYATNTQFLGFLIFAQVVFAAVWDYRQRFFLFLLTVFLFAGTAVPPLGFWDMARWFVLGVGAVAGLLQYLRSGRYRFEGFHLVAFFCVIAAAVSASVSSYPTDSLFKVLSFFLLLLYASCGIRWAVAGAELSFFLRLRWFCEALTYVTAICYFTLRYNFFGNPNSLGAVMGVLVVPVLLWGVFVAEGAPSHKRAIFALLLSVVLLATSYARAGMLAAAISSVLICLALRRFRVMLMLTAVALLAALAAVVIAPPADESVSLTSAFIYKGHRAEGVLGSRKSPWQQSVSSVSEHPWFGTGFGTSATGAMVSTDFSNFRSAARNSREHGNSYLALLEWVGLLGVWPFVGLLMMTGTNIARSLGRMRRAGTACSPLVPIVAVLVAGLIHAAFEDWLFAIGYYLCVVFWGLAFVQVDILAAPESNRLPHF
jgi:O-antigen ligase